MNTRPQHAGFSLIELVTVVLIVGILAGVAAPKLMRGSDEAAIESTISHLKTIALAAEIYQNETGEWPANGGTGNMPPLFSDYLRPNLFAVPCPLGGQYDWDYQINGVTARIKVVDSDATTATWVRVDQRIDDGDLASGRLQYFPLGAIDRYTWTLEE